MLNIQIIALNNPLWMQILQTVRHDIYHLPEYVYLESLRTNTTPKAIVISQGEKLFFLPYLLRRCHDFFADPSESPELFDVISPYGYPGILLSKAAASSSDFLELAMQELISTFRQQNICSAFVRLHPILNAGLEKVYPPHICQISGETIAVDLTLSAEEIWRQTRSDHRKDINRQKRYGLQAKIVDFDKYFADFLEIYYQTMQRVGAPQLYHFQQEYFRNLLHKLGNKLHLGIVEFECEIMCACLFTECGGIVQSYLSGTKNKFLKFSPDKLLFDYVRLWAKERGNKLLHLGGGYGGSKDGVYNFKAGFSPKCQNFLTLRLTIHEERYAHLVELRAKALNSQVGTLLKSNFFPAYRSTVTN